MPHSKIFKKDQTYVKINNVISKVKINNVNSNVNSSNNENINELSLEEIADIFGDNKEGIELTAPLPPPPLSLEQILEKLKYIEDQDVKLRVAKLLLKFEIVEGELVSFFCSIEQNSQKS